MNTLRAVLCSLILTLLGDGATSPAVAANDNAPPVHRVGLKIQHGHARFDLWYANPARARALVGHFNRANGWTVEVLLVPAAGTTRLEYQMDGVQMTNDVLPVFRFLGVASCALQTPDVTTPRVGQALATFGPTNLSLDLPTEALEGDVEGMQYCLHLYTLVPVDTTDLNVVVRLDQVACYSGTMKDGRLTFASACPPAGLFPASTTRTALVPIGTVAATDAATAPWPTRSWGTIKALYR